MIIDNELFYQVLKEMTGYKIEGDYQILGLVNKLAQTKKEYDRIERALIEANEIGYGLVSPSLEDLELAEPEIYRQGNRFGVKLKAKALPSFACCDITSRCSNRTENNQRVGQILLDEFEDDHQRYGNQSIW